jgi:hypothetical protein
LASCRRGDRRGCKQLKPTNNKRRETPMKQPILIVLPDTEPCKLDSSAGDVLFLVNTWIVIFLVLFLLFLMFSATAHGIDLLGLFFRMISATRIR